MAWGWGTLNQLQIWRASSSWMIWIFMCSFCYLRYSYMPSDTNEQIEKAIFAYQNHKYTSIRTCANAFNIPNSTLRIRLRGTQPRSSKHWLYPRSITSPTGKRTRWWSEPQVILRRHDEIYWVKYQAYPVYDTNYCEWFASPSLGIEPWYDSCGCRLVIDVVHRHLVSFRGRKESLATC